MLANNNSPSFLILLTTSFLIFVLVESKLSHVLHSLVNRRPFRSRKDSIGLSEINKQIYLPACPPLLPQHPPVLPRNPRNATSSPEPTSSTRPDPMVGLLNSETEPTSSNFAYAIRYSKTSTVSSHIVGGLQINANLSNYVALLLTGVGTGRTSFCTASIVGPRTIITAGHCVLDNDDNLRPGIRIVFGSRSAYFLSGQMVTPSSIQTHPNYVRNDTSTARFDIAWVGLAQPAPSFSRFMKVNSNASVPLANSVVRVAGYGIHYFTNTNFGPDGELYQVDVPIPVESYCASTWFGLPFDTQRVLCAGYEMGGCGACFGDSGGPLLQYDDADNPVLIGVTSLSAECDRGSTPSLYVRVSAHVSDFLPTARLTLTASTNATFLSGDRLRDPFASPFSIQSKAPEPSPSQAPPLPSSSRGPSVTATPSASHSTSPSSLASASFINSTPLIEEGNQNSSEPENSGVNQTLLFVLLGTLGFVIIGVLIIFGLVVLFRNNRPPEVIIIE